MQNPTDIPASRFREPFFEERARETSWGIPHNHRQPLFGMGRTAQRAPRDCAPPSHLRQAPRVHRAAARQPLAPDAGRMVSCPARRMQSGPKSLAGASAGGRMPGDRAPLLHAHDPNRLKRDSSSTDRCGTGREQVTGLMPFAILPRGHVVRDQLDQMDDPNIVKADDVADPESPPRLGLDQQGLACAIYALALFGQLGGRESSHTCQALPENGSYFQIIDFVFHIGHVVCASVHTNTRWKHGCSVMQRSALIHDVQLVCLGSPAVSAHCMVQSP